MPLYVRRQGYDSGSGKKEFYVPVGFVHVESEVTTVPATGNTTILEVETLGDDRLYVSFSVATQNLDAFVIQVKANEADTYQSLYSTTGDYTTPDGILVGVSADLTTLAAGSSAWFILETKGIYKVRLQASAVANSASVTLHARGS